MSQMKRSLIRINEKHAFRRWQALTSIDVFSGIFIDVPVDYYKTQEWCKSIGSVKNRVDFAFEQDGLAIGFGGLVNIESRHGVAEMYIFIHPDSMGHGYGSYFLNAMLAFGKYELNLRKVSLFVTSADHQIIEFYKKNKFLIEGILKDHIWFRGRYTDRYIMSMFLVELSVDSAEFYGSMI